jgi:hypothetical protein
VYDWHALLMLATSRELDPATKIGEDRGFTPENWQLSDLQKQDQVSSFNLYHRNHLCCTNCANLVNFENQYEAN